MCAKWQSSALGWCYWIAFKVATSNTVLCVSLSFLTHPRVLAIKLHWKMNLWNRAFLWRGMTKIPPHLTVDFDLLWDLRVDPSLSSVLCHYILAKEYHKTTFEFKFFMILHMTSQCMLGVMSRKITVPELMAHALVLLVFDNGNISAALTIEAKTIWPTFYGRHFQMNFLEWKLLHLNLNQIEIYSI